MSDIKHFDIPNDPRQVYKNNGWQGMGDWLGTGTVAYKNIQYKPFNKERPKDSFYWKDRFRQKYPC